MDQDLVKGEEGVCLCYAFAPGRGAVMARARLAREGQGRAVFGFLDGLCGS